MIGNRNRSVRRARVQTVLLSRDPHHRIAVRATVAARPRAGSGKRCVGHRRRAANQELLLCPDRSVTEPASRVILRLSHGSAAKELDLYLSLPKGVWVADAQATFNMSLLDAAVLVVLIATHLNRAITPNSVIIGHIRNTRNGITIPADCLGALTRLHADDPTSVLPGLGPGLSRVDSVVNVGQGNSGVPRRAYSPMGDVVLGIGELLRMTIPELPELGSLLEARSDDPGLTLEAAQPSECGASTTAPAILNGVLASISPPVLARQFAQPVERAQSLHLFSDLTVTSYDDFLAALWPFYVRLLVGMGSSNTSPHDAIVQSDCLVLLDQAYADDGGLKAAWAEARDGLHGGLPSVAAKLAQQFIKNQQATHVTSVICDALKVRSWTERVAIMRDLMARLAVHIRDDADLTAPEKFVEHVEWIARTYIHSLDSIRTRFNAL